MKRAVLPVLLLGALACAQGALAQEDSDLGRIPVLPQSVAAAPAAHGKYYVEDDFSLSSSRGALAVAYPLAASSDWSNRLNLDALDQWSLTPNLTASLSDRLSLASADDIGFPSQAVRNDLREAYLTWEPWDQTYVEAGRINLRGGVALGFNPTDFFKGRTAVSQASLDPSAAREDRLGTAMLRLQHIWDGGSFMLAYAPKLEARSPLSSGSGFTPDFDHTNAADKVLASLNFDLADLNPQILAYDESGRLRFGFDISKPIGQSVIAYAEWAGGRAPDILADAVAFGVATGTLPAGGPLVTQRDAARKFQNDLAVGASWTSVAEITVNLEYHFHQGGFSPADWRDWFTTGAATPALAPELWYVRGYSSDQQQPMSRQQFFLRVDATDAFVTHLEMGLFVLANPIDGSALTQAYASYLLSDNWNAGVYVGGNLGGPRSEWGSTPGAASAIFQLVRYF